ncbi:MAG TPA: hypothetical protein VI792_03310 [Candidatus Eisenbacteria bacterium]
MVIGPAQVRAWERLRDDPGAFCRRLTIQDFYNRKRPIGEWLQEQEEWIAALTHPTIRRTLGVKPRQVGWTTGTEAYLFWKLYTSSRGRRAMQVVHEDSVVTRLRRMVRVFYEGLPLELQGGLEVDNKWVSEFAHNGAAFQRILAGGAGQGRGDTYTDLHATEMAKWRRGSSAVRGEEGLSSDEEMFGSAISTIHDPAGSIIVESTGSGARGLFHRLYAEAIQRPDLWNVVFVSWLNVRRYRIRLTDEQAVALAKDLDADERELMSGHGATLEQLAWRRDRIRSFGMTPLMFLREFPTVITDPFKMAERGWLSPQALDRMLTRFCKRKQRTQDDEFYQLEPPEPGRRYRVGMDCAGGTGEDEACIQVLRDDAVHCATWASKWASQPRQAHMLSLIAGMYNDATAVVEKNNHGDEVIKRASTLGVSLWKNSDGEDWWTGKASKLALLTLLREFIDEGWVAAREFETVRQFQNLVERGSGNIEARSGEHDDRAMAFALALWGGRNDWPRDTRAPSDLWTVGQRTDFIRKRFEEERWTQAMAA